MPSYAAPQRKLPSVAGSNAGFGASRLALAFADELACCPTDQVKARASWTRHGFVGVGGISGLRAQPMLHVHAGLRTLEDDVAVHSAANYEDGRR